MEAKVVELTESKKQIQTIHKIFAEQQDAFIKNPMPSAEERKDNLQRLKNALLENEDKLLDAMHEDFSCRSRDESLLAELMPSVQGINHTMANLAKWMKPEKRHVSMLFMPATNKVHYQPLGVVGVIVPWNYPVYLAVGPLCDALGAGNRVMIKMSEFTPRTSQVFKEIINEIFPENLVAVITGEADVAEEFSKQAYDHLLFTGSTAVGRHVMRAAADNLTPVTLELGGKSPAIISSDVPMKDAAQRIAFGKAFNAGQTCVAPDYVLCPADRVEQFVSSFKESFAQMYPTVKNNDDFTAIINDRQFSRLNGYLEDAKKKGATVIDVNPAGEDMSSGTRKLPVHLVLNATDDMKVLQDEIFGPILPVVTYSSLDEAIAYINARPRPLALYYFGYDRTAQQHVLEQTHSGGVCINDTLMHVAQDDMHFGGVGPSGMGHYHGRDGFMTFSCAKGVHAKQRINSGKLIFPPHGTALHKLIYKMFIR